MLTTVQSPPRITASIPDATDISYQFCFLNRPFVNEENPKDIYYKLLIWPKAKTIIDQFSFLMKINHQGILQPLEFLEFPLLPDNQFDPFGDQHLTVKIPQTFYQSKLQFAFSFSGFNQEDQGQLSLDLNWSNSHQIDDLLIFYSTEEQQSTNLLSWTLDTHLPELTFNQTYLGLLDLTTNLTDLTFEVTDYQSVKQLRFLALLESQKPELKTLTIGNLATKNKPYLFEPKINWLTHESTIQKIYQLQLVNQLSLVDGQIQEVNGGEKGFQANPYMTTKQGLNLNLNFLNHEFNWVNPIKQASLEIISAWEGGYFEI